MIFNNHPLLALSPWKIQNWSEWKRLWQETRSYEQYLGLLHCGFDVSTGTLQEYIDRVCFFLELADNHSQQDFAFKNPSERRNDEMYQLRAGLARTAFAVFAQHFFKDKEESSWREPSWLYPIRKSAVVLEKIIWFFRIDEEEEYIPNLRPQESRKNPSELWAQEFVLALCELGWSQSHELGEKFRERLEAARPNFVEMLVGSGNSNVLLRRSHYHLNEPCWRVLERLALRKRPFRIPCHIGYVSETRVPVSIEEAMANGSAAARLLHTLRAVYAEDKRFKDLEAAARDIEVAKQRIQELQSK